LVAQKITTYPCIQHSRGEPVGTSQIMFSTGRTTRRTMGMPCAEESMMIIYMLSCFDTISERDRRTDRLAIARQHIVVLTRDKNRCGIRVHQCHQMNYVLYDDVVLWLRRNCLYYSLKTDRLFFNFLVVKLSKFSRFCWWGIRTTIHVIGSLFVVWWKKGRRTHGGSVELRIWFSDAGHCYSRWCARCVVAGFMYVQ